MVVDASVLAPALGDDGTDGDRARDRLLDDPSLHGPQLVDLEVMSVFRRRLAAGDMDERRAGLAIRDLEELQLIRYPHLAFAPRIWSLRRNLTPYDAAYVALAELLGAILVTADIRLGGAPGLRCKVEVLARRIQPQMRSPPPIE
ncbi:MAG: type II toxin-antitoxin system VapC family toxin [Actinobacteria bacterium]|nr:type II toxin-antitoxin system VapC family toxin [Actinomycetota bacterium]